MKKIILILFTLLVIPTVFSQIQASGGGGMVKPILYTYEACNDILNGNLERAQDSREKLKKRINIVEFMILFLILYFIITFGMNLQKIKDKGFKKWWKER